MEWNHVIEALLRWLGLVILFTFHEFGHAWMAMRCGDNTARDEGRVSLNPLVHLDPIGSVLVPLIMFLTPGGGFIGWARPVPVNTNNLNNPRRDDVLVTLAGPWMNLVIAALLIALARIGMACHAEQMIDYCFEIAQMSILLFFFNLIPIPPLDGSHILRVATGMSYDTYLQLARFSFLGLIVLMQIRPVWLVLNILTNSTVRLMAHWFGMDL